MEPMPKSDICKLYKSLADEKLQDIKDNINDIKFFEELYAKELLSKNKPEVTLDIIRNLEGLNEQYKTEYNRLKAISVSGIVA